MFGESPIDRSKPEKREEIEYFTLDLRRTGISCNSYEKKGTLMDISRWRFYDENTGIKPEPVIQEGFGPIGLFAYLIGGLMNKQNGCNIKIIISNTGEKIKTFRIVKLCPDDQAFVSQQFTLKPGKRLGIRVNSSDYLIGRYRIEILDVEENT